MATSDQKFSGYNQRSDGSYVPTGEMKTAVLLEDLGEPEVIECNGKRYYPHPDGDALAVIAEYVVALKEEETYISEKMVQAQPAYYAIRDCKWVISSDGYSDTVKFVFRDEIGPEHACEPLEALTIYIGTDPDSAGYYYEDEDIVDHIKEAANYLNLPDDASAEEIEAYCQETAALMNYRILDLLEALDAGERMFLSEEWFIQPNTLFLTHKDAEEHLKANAHHYSAKAHVYCMTAWRSPQYEKFINALKQAF